MKKQTPGAVVLLLLLGMASTAFCQQPARSSDPLPGTTQLESTGDIAVQMIDGVDRFLLKQWDQVQSQRRTAWLRLLAAKQDREPALDSMRQKLLQCLGAGEERIAPPTEQIHFHWVVSLPECEIFSLSWPVIREVRGEGLLLIPAAKREAFRSAISQGSPFPAEGEWAICLPDADQSPEALVGLLPGVVPASQFPRHLAERGVTVVVPILTDRRMEKRNNRCTISNREFLYRPAFELGRHLLGYELQTVRSLVDWIETLQSPEKNNRSVAVAGYGEGGLVALLTGAVDSRIRFVGVSGYFSAHTRQWDEPLDRNVFGIWNHFGNAELAALAVSSPSHPMIAIEASRGPEVDLAGEGGGAPSSLKSPTSEEVQPELSQLGKYAAILGENTSARICFSKPKTDAFGTEEWLQGIGNQESKQETDKANKESLGTQQPAQFDKTQEEGWQRQAEERARRVRDAIERDTQHLLVESPYVRAQFMKNIDTSSLEKFRDSTSKYRDIFANEIIGTFDLPLGKPFPRTRKAYEEANWTGYEVVLDLFPDVFAYGLLLVPKNIPEGERRPVVVCQHGLEGRPQDVIGDSKREAYEAFAAQLAERGYVTFAPQNIYLGKDRFRTLQRKANPLGKTLFSIMVPQHQQIVRWLATLPFVDGKRIAFYGLSYGGKSAMRIPPLVPEYSAVICSADFNDWVWKNASTRAPYSYVWTGEYEIFEWNLGSTFNYSEMAALIAPRPFMVERGHFDGVASDEAVAYEFAKVRNLYSARLKIPTMCEMEVFDGPHKIHGVGTFAFLDRHLNHSPTQATRATDTAAP